MSETVICQAQISLPLTVTEPGANGWLQHRLGNWARNDFSKFEIISPPAPPPPLPPTISLIFTFISHPFSVFTSDTCPPPIFHSLSVLSYLLTQIYPCTFSAALHCARARVCLCVRVCTCMRAFAFSIDCLQHEVQMGFTLFRIGFYL